MIRIYLDTFKKYAVFRGRAGRKEYWIFILSNIILWFLIAVACDLLALSTNIPTLANLIYIFILAIALPSVAVQTRRLHDTNRSAWWLLMGLIPLAGEIVLLVFGLLDGHAGANQYGPYPNGGSTNQAAPLSEPPVNIKRPSLFVRITIITLSVLAFILSGLYALFAFFTLLFCDSGPSSTCVNALGIAMFFWLVGISMGVISLIIMNKKSKLALFLSIGAFVVGFAAIFLLFS
jgi:uncharacterized membrane protein YhaH (DUF805 family)